MKMSIKDLTLKLKEEYGMPQTKIAKLLGVSTLMVHNYQKGKVVSPNPSVAFNVWNNIAFEGEKVVLDNFKDEAQLKQAYEFHNS